MPNPYDPNQPTPERKSEIPEKPKGVYDRPNRRRGSYWWWIIAVILIVIIAWMFLAGFTFAGNDANAEVRQLGGDIVTAVTEGVPG